MQSGALQAIELLFAASATLPLPCSATPPFFGAAWKYTALPTITGISGCDYSNNADGQYRTNCDPGTVTVTLTGANLSMWDHSAFPGYPATQAYITIGAVTSKVTWRSLNSTTLRLQLWEN